MKVFGERLKELRKNNNLSQEDFGKIFENAKSQSAIGTWERGDREPSMEDIIIIAKHFNVSIDYLFGIEESKDRRSIYLQDNTKEENDIIEFLEEENVKYKELKLRKSEKDLIKRIVDAVLYE